MNKNFGWIKGSIRKLRKKGGFTFTELLVATMITVLATGSLTSALILAIRHFYRSTQRTEAQFLCASLAEFVEDELCFSVPKVTGGSLESWSKGTHNMGSGIRFFVQNDDGDTPIDEGTIGIYGKLAMTGENNKDGDGNYKYFRLVSDGAYEVEKVKGYSLLASMSLQWDETNQWYEVEIKAVDENDKTVLSTEKFTVTPAIGSL